MVRRRFDSEDQESHRVLIFSRTPIIVFDEWMSECRVRSITEWPSGGGLDEQPRGARSVHVGKATPGPRIVCR
jgi:hypothetical protein